MVWKRWMWGTTDMLLWICVLLLAAALYLFMIWPNLPRRDISSLSGVDYAHRGLWNDEFPENSLPAFQNAVEHGFGMEMDVHLTSDGELVVFHDDNLKRMCGVDRNIHDCTLAELQALRLLDTDCRIPTFNEFLTLVDGRVPLIIELKMLPNVTELCEKVHARLQSYPGVYCIESFDPRAVRWWRQHAPHIIRGTLSFGLKGKPAGERKLQHRLMAALMVDVMTRPDFIAYEAQTDGNVAMSLMRLLRPTLVAWTVRSQREMDALRGRYDLQIFEGFVPKH